MTSIEKIRNIVDWADNQNEYFNERFKSVSDIEKVFDYCKNKNIEFLDDLSYLDEKDYLRVVWDVVSILGYSVF